LARIRSSVRVGLPDLVSADDTLELNLTGYGGPAVWRLVGPGELIGPGMTWTIDSCVSALLVSGESCAYTGTNRWQYYAPWSGTASGPLTFTATVGRLTFEKTVTLTAGTLSDDERHALQFFNHARAIPGFCQLEFGPGQSSAGPLRWDVRLKRTAVKAATSQKVLSNAETNLVAQGFGYRSLKIRKDGNLAISGVAGGGLGGEQIAVEPNRLFTTAFQVNQARSSTCPYFHDAELKDFGAAAAVINPSLSSAVVITASE